MNIKPYLLFAFIIATLPCISIAKQSGQAATNWQAIADRSSANWQAIADRSSANWRAFADRSTANWRAIADRSTANWQSIIDNGWSEWSEKWFLNIGTWIPPNKVNTHSFGQNVLSPSSGVPDTRITASITIADTWNNLLGEYLIPREWAENNVQKMNDLGKELKNKHDQLGDSPFGINPDNLHYYQEIIMKYNPHYP